jgi:hypothetical protein
MQPNGYRARWALVEGITDVDTGERNMRTFTAGQVVVVVAALLAAPVAGAAELTSPTAGMVGMTRDQIARVSVFHGAGDAGIVCPDIVEIVDAGGKVLATSQAELFPGTGTFFDYDLAQGLKRGQRLQFHVIVRTRPDHPGGASLEIYDRKTGVTRVVVTPSIIPDASLIPQ